MEIADRLDRLDGAADAGWRRALIRAARFLLALWDQLVRDNVVIRASGLAYSTLFAFVPLLAVLFAMFSAFSAYDDLKHRVQDLLFSQLLPTSQQEIVAYINQFTVNTNRLGFIGFLFLIITSIMLIDNIEKTFNAIWHGTGRRTFVAKITAYTSVLVFGTLLIGASLSISAKIKAMLMTGTVLELSFLSRLGSWLVPLLLSTLAFLFMYLVVPFTRVRLRSAFAGAVVASILWEVGKHLFAGSVGQSVRFSAIYGSLALIPIFLIWLYITWVIVLGGLEVAYTHQHFGALMRTRAFQGAAARDRIGLAVKMATVVSRCFLERQPPPTADALADLFRVPLEAVEREGDRLVGTGLLRRANDDNGGEGLVPATAPGSIRVAEVIRAVFDGIGGNGGDQGVDRTVDELIGEFETAGYRAVGDITLETLARAVTEKGNVERGTDRARNAERGTRNGPAHP